MKKATKLKAAQYKWATDQMKPGVVYSLYLKEEIIPVSKDKRKIQKKTYLKISHKTGARFISKAFICNDCGHLFFVKRMQNNICADCQILERQRKSRERTKANCTTKANRKKKKKVVEVKPTSCCGCVKLTKRKPFVFLERNMCVFDVCSSSGYDGYVKRGYEV